MVDFPKNSDEITPAWLSQVLNRTVSVCDVTRIGMDEGFTGAELFRVVFDGESMVAKFSPKDVDLRSNLHSANAREVQFYSRFAQDHSLPAPKCFYGHIDSQTGSSILLLEDIGTARAVPFVQGCTLADATCAVDALAQLHRAFWNDPILEEFQGVETLEEFDFASVWAKYPAALTRILGLDAVPDRLMLLGDYFVDQRHEVFSHLLNFAPMTLLHRDFQVDNLLFQKDAVSILDWQFVGKGRGAYDLAYFLISSMTPKARKLHERDIVAQYVAALGRDDYGFEACWRDYILGVFGKINVTVIASVLYDNDTPNKRTWRQADLERLTAFCDDHQISPETLVF